MLSYYEMKLLTEEADRVNKIARWKKEDREQKQWWKDFYVRRKARKDKWIKVMMPEYLRRLEYHIEIEIVKAIDNGYLTLQHDLKISHTTVYTEKRYVMKEKPMITKDFDMTTSGKFKLKEIGSLRKLQMFITVARYYNKTDKELMNKILINIGGRLGLKITRGKFSNNWETYIHLEIR